jgi:hypothetical protein
MFFIFCSLFQFILTLGHWFFLFKVFLACFCDLFLTDFFFVFFNFGLFKSLCLPFIFFRIGRFFFFFEVEQLLNGFIGSISNGYLIIGEIVSPKVIHPILSEQHNIVCGFGKQGHDVRRFTDEFDVEMSQGFVLIDLLTMLTKFEQVQVELSEGVHGLLIKIVRDPLWVK